MIQVYQDNGTAQLVEAVEFTEETIGKAMEWINAKASATFDTEERLLLIENPGGGLYSVVGARFGSVIYKEHDKFYVCAKSDFLSQFELYPLIGSGETTDGYHTFNELYYHRMILFVALCQAYKDRAWKSKLHDDGSMYEGYFVVGIATNVGQFSYHYHERYWHMFNVKELEAAPKFDGHTSNDVTRLLTLAGTECEDVVQA